MTATTQIMTEADTCRELVTPKLVEAGWGNAPHVIGEQRTFTNGRIIVTGGRVRRGKQKRADYLLYYRRDYPLAVVEAKELGLPAKTGVQQAKDYAEVLGLKFAYATNGHRIIEIDYTTGSEREVDRFATLGLEKLMAIPVPIPSKAVHCIFDALQAKVAELKARHATIRQANDALIPATLERVFDGAD